MLHLALVQNLLTAVGAAPRFARPNFPMPAYAYPAGVRIELLPFGEAALRHFAFLERPEGMDVEDAEGFEAFERAVAFEHDNDGRDRPPPPGVRDDRRALPGRSAWGSSTSRAGSAPERLFIGPANAQATEEHFRWEELVAVTDLASATRAIDTIVEQGEGAQGEWRDAHFGRLLGILDDYLALKAADPELRARAAPSSRRTCASRRPASSCRSSPTRARRGRWTSSTSCTRSCSSSSRATSPTATRRPSSCRSSPTSRSA